MQARKERKVSNRTAYGESAECAWVISALTLLRTGSAFRKEVLLLPVDLGGGGGGGVPEEGLFSMIEGREVERSLTPQFII